MNLEEIRAASAREFKSVQEDGEEISETTPEFISIEIVGFVDSLHAGSAEFVDVIDDPHGLYGWCSDGVMQKIISDGGQIVFGWTIWEFPGLFLTAEFHAVWEDPKGVLLDITPKPMGERRILFVPDRSYPPDFDFDKRPLNRRARIFEGRNRGEAAKGKLARLSAGKLRYEENRASKAKMSLLEWLVQKEPQDPIELAIDEFLEACDAFDEHFDTLGASGLVEPDEKFIRLANNRLSKQEAFKRIIRKLNS